MVKTATNPKPANGLLAEGRAWLRKVLAKPADAPTERFIDFCREKWPRRTPSGDAVVLVNLFPVAPSMFCSAYVANHLATRLGGRVEAFHFAGAMPDVIARAYAAFGAECTLTSASAENERSLAEALAGELFSGLRTKWDVVNLAVEGLRVGDQIYDTYLRTFNEPTVLLTDPRLREVIRDALLIYFAVRAYVAGHRVEALLTDDFSYLFSGIITRVLFRARVPIFVVMIGQPFYLVQLDPEHSGPGPDGFGHGYPVPVVTRYYEYPATFARLPEDLKMPALAKARQRLQARLAGEEDALVRMAQSTYGAGGARLFPSLGPPRVLVMLHDFIDSPHGYRSILFPDFHEWIHFLLGHAQETPFAWYVKPHPASADPARSKMTEANRKALDALRQRYPKIHFLPPGTSNRQIIEEGVSAMFTVYGTAGHEYAYAGIPVVNAGDNPHSAYPFNLHATSLDHYRECIREADRLTVTIEPAAIEEYFYMHYFHLAERHGAAVNPIDERIAAAPEFASRLSDTAMFDGMIAGVTPAREQGVHEYLSRFFDRAGLPKKL